MKLRGEAIHTHLYIPCPVAEAALHLARLAVKEFEDNWLKRFYPNTFQKGRIQRVECPRWSELCKDLELDFLPPKLRD